MSPYPRTTVRLARLNCAHCKKFFWTKKPNQRFCRQRCQQSWHRAQKAAQRPPKPIPTTRRCLGCGETKSLEEFYAKKSRCKPCQNAAIADWKRRNPDKVAAGAKRWRSHQPEYAFAWNLRKQFGMELEDYERLLSKQGGQCAICGKSPGVRRLAVDHDHKTGRVRGLLCGSCNTALGKLGDTAEGLTRAIQYLQSGSDER